MAYEKELQGTIWYNDQKRTENSPNWTGKVLINGVEYRIAGWNKTLDSGKKLVNLKLSIPDENYQQNNSDPATSDDACPF